MFICVSRKFNSLLGEAESWNLVDLDYRETTQTKGKHLKPGKLCHGGSEMGDQILFYMFFKKASPFIDEVESLNMAYI
jgi:hypothetical protein